MIVPKLWAVRRREPCRLVSEERSCKGVWFISRRFKCHSPSFPSNTRNPCKHQVCSLQFSRSLRAFLDVSHPMFCFTELVMRRESNPYPTLWTSLEIFVKGLGLDSYLFVCKRVWGYRLQRLTISPPNDVKISFCFFQYECLVSSVLCIKIS